MLESVHDREPESIKLAAKEGHRSKGENAFKILDKILTRCAAGNTGRNETSHPYTTIKSFNLLVSMVSVTSLKVKHHSCSKNISSYVSERHM